jgi:hypothetical protein
MVARELSKRDTNKQQNEMFTSVPVQYHSVTS